jgi:lipoyl(octanoyl) transferase
MISPPIVRELGTRDFQSVWQEMRDFTDNRNASSDDEIWLVQHPPIFTLGLNGKPEHILDSGDIPVLRCDRGGQVTYHGPGQIIAYVLIDLRRRNLGIKHLVHCLEQAVIEMLEHYSIKSNRRANAPGVYINEAKIAALGLRVRRGCSYHGLSVNIDMELEPYRQINPCGIEGLKSTMLKKHYSDCDVESAQLMLQRKLLDQFEPLGTVK